MRNDLRVSLREERASQTRRPAPRQRNFLSERKLRQPRNQLILRIPFQLRGNARQQRKLHEIHQVKIAQQSQRDEPRRPRMKRQRLLHAVILQQGLAPRHFFENFRRQIFSLQQHAQLRFLERRIIEQRQQHVRVGMVQ